MLNCARLWLAQTARTHRQSTMPVPGHVHSSIAVPRIPWMTLRIMHKEIVGTNVQLADLKEN
jgi:hypothetical protein